MKENKKKSSRECPEIINSQKKTRAPSSSASQPALLCPGIRSVEVLLPSQSLSIIVPVFNEKENIPFLVAEINKTMPLICRDYEVILVDDASTDGTGEMLDAVAGVEKKISVLHNRTNKTLGGTLREGFSSASKDWILYFDADLPFDLKEIMKAFALVNAENADFLSAYRMNRGIEGLRRSLYSYSYNKIIEFFFNLGIQDVNFSFKLFRRDLLKEITLSSEGSFINVEMLAQLRMAGRKIVQFPVTYYPRTRGRSKLSGLKTIIKILYELTKFFCWYHCEQKEKRTQMEQSMRLLYCDVPWWVRWYAHIRSKTCPFQKIGLYIPKERKILDLGCGFGFFDMWLFQQSEKREIVGVDWQEKRIVWGQRICEREKMNLKFVAADYNKIPLGAQDTILLIDTLYLLPPEQQKSLLCKCHQSLSPGGKLVIKEMSRVPQLKYFWLLFQEYLATKIANFNHSKQIYVTTEQEMVSFLTGLGFVVEALRFDRGYFYPHILYSCLKK